VTGDLTAQLGDLVLKFDDPPRIGKREALADQLDEGRDVVDLVTAERRRPPLVRTGTTTPSPSRRRTNAGWTSSNAATWLTV
jgi:hypothetical protein